MRRVKNRAVIRQLATRIRRGNKGKNLVAILAIVLTTMMITSVFTIGGSLLKKTQEETMRQVGGSSHAGYKYLTAREYDQLKQDKWLKEISCRICVGDLVNKEVKKLPTEVNYFEDKDARWAFCYPEKGHMPQRNDEIVTSDLVLKALGADCRLGEKVDLQIQIGEKTVKQEFTLCGYFKGDLISMAQMLLVSKSFQEKYAPVPTTSVMKEGTELVDYTGRIMADFNYYTSLGITQQTRALSKRLGYPQDYNVGINWAYLGKDIDISSVVQVAALLGVILLSGYLIIYNIFYLNVYQDISKYGLLKTIGTTGKQLKSIVRRQAWILSLYGIPLGLLLGALTGKSLLPVIMANLTVADIISDDIVLNGWIFVGAAVFSFATVYISCIKPCCVASGVTPIEAVRYTEGQETAAGEKRRHRKEVREIGQNEKELQERQRKKLERRQEKAKKKLMKKTRRVSPGALAGQNIKRNRKRVFIVVASLSLALILLNCVYSFVKGLDINSFVSNFTVCDYSVQDATLDNSVILEKELEGVTKEFQQELKQQKGITEMGNVYATEASMAFTDEEYQLIEKRIFDNPEAQETLAYYAVPEEGGAEEYIQSVREERAIDGKLYGMAELPMEKLNEVEGDLTWEKFRTGKYVIATRLGFPEEGGGINFFEPGETVHLQNGKGEEREYEVLAVANIPYAVITQWFGMFDCDFILPEEEYLDFVGPTQPMRTLFNVEKEYEEQLEEWVEEYCTVVNSDLDFNSRQDIVEEFATYKQMLVLVGNLLVVVLAGIGILNFINTMVTSILSRRQELAMLEAVGMTRGQLRRMLMLEGGYYALFTMVVSLALGTLIDVLLLRPFAEGFIGFHWQFTVTPILLCIPVLVLVVLVVPMISFWRMYRISVVERIRRAE